MSAHSISQSTYNSFSPWAPIEALAVIAVAILDAGIHTLGPAARRCLSQSSYGLCTGDILPVVGSAEFLPEIVLRRARANSAGAHGIRMRSTGCSGQRRDCHKQLRPCRHILTRYR